MSRETPKGRSPWTTLPIGTLVRVGDGPRTGVVRLVRRKKYARRYGVDFGDGALQLVLRPEMRAI